MTIQIAYRKAEAAKVCGVGETRIQDAVNSGDLTPVYPDSHPRFLHDDLVAWAQRWPGDKPTTNA